MVHELCRLLWLFYDAFIVLFSPFLSLTTPWAVLQKHAIFLPYLFSNFSNLKSAIKIGSFYKTGHAGPHPNFLYVTWTFFKTFSLSNLIIIISYPCKLPLSSHPVRERCISGYVRSLPTGILTSRVWLGSWQEMLSLWCWEEGGPGTNPSCPSSPIILFLLNPPGLLPTTFLTWII